LAVAVLAGCPGAGRLSRCWPATGEASETSLIRRLFLAWS